MKYLPLLLILLATSPLIQADTEANYEMAVKSFAEGKENDAFIHVKNALQDNAKHLPSRLLLSELYFNAGNIPAAEEELYNALDLGADINLVLPLLGTTLILQNKVDELLAFGNRQSEFTKRTRFEWALLMGQAFLIEGNPDQAEIEFTKASNMFEDDTRALNSLASAYLRVGKLAQAEQSISASLARNSDNAKTWQLRGELSLKRGHRDEAINHFEKALSLDKTDPKVLRSLAATHLKNGDMDAVRKYLAIINEQTPNDPTATLIGAWLMLVDNDLEKANQTLSKLSDELSVLDAKQLEQHANLLFIQGVSEYIRGNLEKAKSHLLSYLERAPQDLGAMQLLIDLYLRTGQERRAIEFLEGRKRDIAGNLTVSLKLVQLYINDNKLINAERFLEQLRAIHGDLPLITLMQASIEKQRKRYAEALAMLNEEDFTDSPPLGFYLLKGELQMLLSRFDDARSNVNTLLKNRPDNTDVLNIAIALELRTGNPDRALTLIDQAVALSPDNLNALFNKAIALKVAGDPDAALIHLKQLAEKFPEHTPTLLLLARTEVEQGNPAEAKVWISKIYSYDPDNRSATELKLSILIAEQNWQEALTVVNNLMRYDRLNPDYLLDRAQTLTNLERAKEAQKDLGILYGLWSESPRDLQRLHRFQLAAGDPEGARKSLEKAQSLASDSLTIKLDLANLALQQGDLVEAAELTSALAALHGTHSAVLLLQGDLAAAQDDLPKARDLYEKAFKADTANAKALINLYQLTLKGIGVRAFSNQLAALVKQNSSPIWWQKLLADSYLNQGQTNEAKPLYEALLTHPQFANDESIYNNLANIYAGTDLGKALTMAEKGLTLNRQNAALLDTTGWILAKQKNYGEALNYLREAFSMNARDPEIRYHLGYTLAQLNRNAEAVRELQAALDSGYDFPGKEDAAELLSRLQ